MTPSGPAPSEAGRPRGLTSSRLVVCSYTFKDSTFARQASHANPPVWTVAVAMSASARSVLGRFRSL